MSNFDVERYEKLLREKLRVINECAKAEAQPIIDELVKIEAMKPIEPLIIDTTDAVRQSQIYDETARR